MRSSLADPDLSPTTVAAEHRISVRTLHYAFAAAGTSFAGQLMLARLERARALLGICRSPKWRLAVASAIPATSRAGSDVSSAWRRSRFAVPPAPISQVGAPHDCRPMRPSPGLPEDKPTLRADSPAPDEVCICRADAAIRRGWSSRS